MTRRRKFVLLGILVLLGAVGLSLPFWYIPRDKKVVGFDKSQLIRFHVIANSDSTEDQALKRRIRDLIVEDMGNRFNKNGSVEEARIVAMANLPRMEEIARQQIKREGKDYQVKAMLGEYYFPIKNYGDTILPAGKYKAVRVVIGAGQGANWWCVLFPPACFHDVNKAISDDIPFKEQEVASVISTGQTDKEQLDETKRVNKENKKVVKKEKLKSAKKAATGNKGEIKVRFKFVELMQESNIKFMRKLGNNLAAKE